MKLNRRAFLQFAAGAVGGTLLSPLPWKLADDTAIWSQNWSWRPKSQPGETTWQPSICRYCPGGCGIRVRLIDNKRAVAVVGNPDSPSGRGNVCPMGISSLQLQYSPARIPAPLKQTSRRGDVAGFKPISWKEAIGEIVRILKKLNGESETNGVAWITGDRSGSMGEFIDYFLQNYGSPNHFYMPSSVDSQQLVNLAMQGLPHPVSFDMERAALIFSFGANLFEGWGSPVWNMQLFTSSGNGDNRELIHFDWRESLTCGKATEWIPIKPGSQAAVALGMCHVIVKEGLYNREFVENNCTGFDDWEDASGIRHRGFKTTVLKEYSPTKVSGLTGIPAKQIADLARRFARQRPSLAIWGTITPDTPGSFYEEMAFVSLNALVGNINRPGGLVLQPEVPLKPFEDAFREGTHRKELEELKIGKDAAEEFPFGTPSVYGALEEISGSGHNLVKLLFLYEANPAYCLPEPEIYLKAIEKIDTVVSFSSFLDETSVYSDLILPNHTFLERWDDFTTPRTLPCAVYGISKPVLKPNKKTRHTGDVLIAIAKALGGETAKNFPWTNYEAVLKWRLQGIAEKGEGRILEGEDIEKLVETHAGLEPNFKSVEDLWSKLTEGSFWVNLPDFTAVPSFRTPSKKFEFYATRLQRGKFRKWKDKLFVANYFPLEPSGKKDEFPFLLIPYEILQLATSQVANPPFMTKLLPDTLLKAKDIYVQVNSSTAKKAGLSEGMKVVLETPVGKAPVRIHISEQIAPGVIAMACGLGHSAFDVYIKGKGVNAYKLTEVQIDPMTGIGTWWATRAKLIKA